MLLICLLSPSLSVLHDVPNAASLQMLNMLNYMTRKKGRKLEMLEGAWGGFTFVEE